MSSPIPRTCVTFPNNGEELLVPRPTPKLEGHPLSAVRDKLSVILSLNLLLNLNKLDILSEFFGHFPGNKAAK
jgi:hypothetical protein